MREVKKLDLDAFLHRLEIARATDELQALFSLRNLVEQDGDTVRVIGDGAEVLTYYANSIKHHFPA